MAGKATGGGSGGAKKTEGAAGGQQDYGDKAFTAGEQKFGIAPNKERDEKITDKVRLHSHRTKR